MRTAHFILVTLLSIMIQSAAHAAELAPNTIVASGSAEVLVSPDTASIDIGVVTASPTTAAALQANNVEMARVVAAVRAVGIPDSAIQTSNFSIQAQHPDGKNGYPDESRTIGYEVTNKLTVTVSDLSKVADILDAAVKAGANSSNSVSFDVKNHAIFDDQALADAVRDARHKAETMATAEHAKVGRMISMTNELTYGEVGRYMPAPAFIRPPDSRTPILPGQISIDAQVIVVFAVE